MKLTSLQKDCIKKLAAADVRAEDTMLGLLLLEGIRFYYLWRIKPQCIK
jgi:hypothetical protein